MVGNTGSREGCPSRMESVCKSIKRERTPDTACSWERLRGGAGGVMTRDEVAEATRPP